MSIACMCECGHSVSGVCLDRIPQCFKLIKNLEPMKSLLEQFKAGKIAAKNDVEPEQLNRLLKWASPENAESFGKSTTYYIVDGSWESGALPHQKTFPASKLLAELDALETPEFKWSEEVEVKDKINDTWMKAVFCCLNPTASKYRYITISPGESPYSWAYCRRPVPTITITLDEAKTYAAAVLGTTADKIEIK